MVRGRERPVPFGLDLFVAGLERQRNRPIRLATSTTRPGPRHSTRPISPCTRSRTCRLLAPDLDQTLIQLILGRGAYRTAEERDAEMLASLIMSS
jgi:hypothetical protein